MRDEPLPDAGACESEAARLLPWFVTGRLGAEESGKVARHLERCATCRGDLAEQSRLQSALRAEGSIEFAPQAGLAATMNRIDELERQAAPRPPSAFGGYEPARKRRIRVSQWLTAAVLVQAVGLGVLSSALVSRPPMQRPEMVYRTRSAPAAPASPPLIRAVFATSMTLGDLEQLLEEQHLVIVAGPSRAGVFTLGAASRSLAPAAVSRTLVGLRTNPSVRFAEPVTDAERGLP